jgi:two-component sensor histidine kinase
MAMDELINNAIEHTSSGQGGKVQLAVALIGSGVIRVEVTDDNGVTTIPRSPAGTGLEEHGRGLQIVEAVSTSWGTQQHRGSEPPRNTVWFEALV